MEQLIICCSEYIIIVHLYLRPTTYPKLNMLSKHSSQKMILFRRLPRTGVRKGYKMEIIIITNNLFFEDKTNKVIQMNENEMNYEHQ